MKSSLLVTVLALAALAPSGARADYGDWTAVEQFHPTPEHFGIELRVGSYTPLNLGASWNEVFGNDIGPLVALELHYFPGRVRYLGLIGGGVGIGWSQWSGVAMATTASTQSEDIGFEIIPISVNIVWRFDTLARELGIPIVITPKVGLDVVHWQTGTSTRTQAAGWSIGPRFAGKISLELDFLEPRAARRLDDEWGVNHSEVFFEPWYSMAGDLINGELPLSGWGWVAGLGLTF